MEGGPWDYEVEDPPKHKTKSAYRKWCLNDNTEHLFFTPFEGVNANVRIEDDNPPLIAHGWVGDYDSDITFEEVMARIDKMPPDIRPTHMSKTFSGGLRTVWEFEEQVWVDCPEVTDRFIRKLKEHVKAARLAPGFDNASLKPHMVWELGSDWMEVPDSMPIPAMTTRRIYKESVLQTKKVKSEYTDIPFDVVQKAIEEKFPGRLNGCKLAPGERIPLFWIPKTGDGKENDKSAIVAEWGCYSFSSRSDKGRMFWDELLGADFMRQFREKKINEATENLYYDGVGYWKKNFKGHWVGMNREDMVLHLKVERSLSATRKPTETASEAEQVLHAIQNSNRVDATAPFLHTQDRFVKWNGETYLNINRRFACDPAAPEAADPNRFPWLYDFFSNFLDKHALDKVHPMHFMLSEIKRGYQSFLDGTPTSGHINVLVGPSDRGKSLLTTFVLREIFGSASDAGAFLVEGKGFNKELGESAVWFIDDNKSTSSMTQHKNFSESIKKHAATPEVQYHPKFKDARPIPWYGRIWVSCNEDPDSITIVPDLDITIRDKINLFRVNAEWKAEFLPNFEMAELIREELPYFLSWLLQYEPPEGVLTPSKPRYGIAAYHHPDLVEIARESSSQFRMSEILDIWRGEQAGSSKIEHDEKGSYWEGTSTELLRELSVDELAPLVRSYTVITFGRQLSALAKLDEYPALTSRVLKGKKLWRVEVPEAKVPEGGYKTPEEAIS